MMLLSSFLYNPSKLRILLFLVAAVCALIAYVLSRVRAKRSGEASGPVILLNLDQPAAPAEQKPPAAETVPAASPVPTGVQPPGYAAQTLQGRSSLALDLLRGALVILALVVAAGFILVIVPQRSVDSMSQGLQARSGKAPKQEMIALLYLGDEIKEKEFHIRGAVRNITTQPIEKLDASVRLYGSDGTLIETAIVRMDKETFSPDEVAEFHLVYPDYNMQFRSYAVDFKLRQGDLIPYKDMRGTRPQS